MIELTPAQAGRALGGGPLAAAVTGVGIDTRSLRAGDVFVALRGERVSRQHAALVPRGGAWWVEDLGSRNGTFCEGERVARRRLRDGDVLELGDEAVRCRLQGRPWMSGRLRP